MSNDKQAIRITGLSVIIILPTSAYYPNYTNLISIGSPDVRPTRSVIKSKLYRNLKMRDIVKTFELSLDIMVTSKEGAGI